MIKFNHTWITAPTLVAAITLTAAATVGGINTTPERVPDVPHFGDLPKGYEAPVVNIGTRGGELGNAFEKVITVDPPGLGDRPEGAVNYDIDGNGYVDFMDLVDLLAHWGFYRGPADLTGDNVVDIRDLVLFLANMPRMPEVIPDRDGPTGVQVPKERDYRRPEGPRVIDFGQQKAEG